VLAGSWGKILKLEKGRELVLGLFEEGDTHEAESNMRIAPRLDLLRAGEEKGGVPIFTLAQLCPCGPCGSDEGEAGAFNCRLTITEKVDLGVKKIDSGLKNGEGGGGEEGGNTDPRL